MASVRLYLDEDVRPLLAEILRDRGFDAISASRTHRLGLTDREQLEVAIKERRALLTHNIRDFVRLHTELADRHEGIIVSNQAPLPILLRRVLGFFSRETAASITGRLCWLSDYEPRRE
ncbi:MAG: DUF5615 family PIN-like protein [Candidatus Omnitrophica bacterium]|nr:DUF5615 family PIN-like protein [Candidatus Omnitrophota bacterium]